jgi:hypothetical protein
VWPVMNGGLDINKISRRCRMPNVQSTENWAGWENLLILDRSSIRAPSPTPAMCTRVRAEVCEGNVEKEGDVLVGCLVTLVDSHITQGQQPRWKVCGGLDDVCAPTVMHKLQAEHTVSVRRSEVFKHILTFTGKGKKFAGCCVSVKEVKAGPPAPRIRRMGPLSLSIKEAGVTATARVLDPHWPRASPAAVLFHCFYCVSFPSPCSRACSQIYHRTTMHLHILSTRCNYRQPCCASVLQTVQGRSQLRVLRPAG